MSALNDDTIKIYSVKTGSWQKTVLSKKYGVKCAKFMHSSSCLLYASTKVDRKSPDPISLLILANSAWEDAIRYLTTHDSSFIRYFKGHTEPVTCLAVHPGADNFVSCSKDNTIRIWDANSQNPCGKLYLHYPYLAAWDPSATTFAVASQECQTILIYDYRKFDQMPTLSFDLLKCAEDLSFDHQDNMTAKWTKLEFSNDGKCLLLATKRGHFILDAFSGKLKTYLVRPTGHTGRLAPGESSEDVVESSGDVSFSQDGRFVVGGSGSENVYVWDTYMMSGSKLLDPLHTLDFKGCAAVLAFNPRYNFFATADKETVMWAPEL